MKGLENFPGDSYGQQSALYGRIRLSNGLNRHTADFTRMRIDKVFFILPVATVVGLFLCWCKAE